MRAEDRRYIAIAKQEQGEQQLRMRIKRELWTVMTETASKFPESETAQMILKRALQ